MTLSTTASQNNVSDLEKRWHPIWSQIPPNIVSVEDYEHVARQTLPKNIQAYLFENNLNGMDNNATALDKKYWLPQVLKPEMPNFNCHLYNPDSAVPLDIHLPHPLWLSPVAHQGLYHPDAERATLEGATLLQTPCIFSSMGNTHFDKILPHPAPIGAVQWYWQPLIESVNYPLTDTITGTETNRTLRHRQYNLDLINALIDKGLTLLVITVDAPHAGVRSVSRRMRVRLPSYCQTVNLPSHSNLSLSLEQLLAQAPTWEDIEWLVSHCKVPVFLKGIMHPKDAKRAQSIGCAGIIVSNHGRRVLADVLAVAEILPMIREQVGNDMIIIADGGIRSGSDMAKLIALGADAVAIGRGYIYGLALAGALGVAHVNKILLEELQVTMAVLGVKNLAELRQDNLLYSS